jgi:hypothetical protein
LGAATGLVMATGIPAQAWAPPAIAPYLTPTRTVWDFVGNPGQIIGSEVLISPVHAIDKCLTAHGHTTGIDQQPCDRDSAKRFSFVATGGENGHTSFRLFDGRYNQCMGVAGSTQANGGRVVSWNCLIIPDQRFYLEVVRTGNEVLPTLFRFRPAHSGKCLGISASSTAPGAPLIQWNCIGVQDQVFLVEWV